MMRSLQNMSNIYGQILRFGGSVCRWLGIVQRERISGAKKEKMSQGMLV